MVRWCEWLLRKGRNSEYRNGNSWPEHSTWRSSSVICGQVITVRRSLVCSSFPGAPRPPWKPTWCPCTSIRRCPASRTSCARSSWSTSITSIQSKFGAAILGRSKKSTLDPHSEEKNNHETKKKIAGVCVFLCMGGYTVDGCVDSEKWKQTIARARVGFYTDRRLGHQQQSGGFVFVVLFLSLRGVEFAQYAGQQVGPGVPCELSVCPNRMAFKTI